MKTPYLCILDKGISALIAFAMLLATQSAQALAFTWNGGGVGSNAGTDWTAGNYYLGGSVSFSSANDLDFGSITTGGNTTLGATAGTYDVKNLYFSSTNSTITAAETLYFNGNGTAGAVTINLGGDISLPSPGGSKVILGSDLILNLGNASHSLTFFKNNNVTTQATPAIVVINSQITGGGASASLSNIYSAYGTSSATPAILLTNNNSTFDAKIGTISGILAYTSIGNVGAASSSLGAPSTANATITLANGSFFEYVGSGNQSSDRPFSLGGNPGIYNCATTSSTLTLSGAITVSSAAGTTSIRTGASASNVLVYDSVLADNGAGKLAIYGYGAASVPNMSGAVSSVAMSGTVILKGANTYTGSTNIDSGVFLVSNLASYGTASNLGKGTGVAGADVIISGGTLQYTGAVAANPTGRYFTIGDSRGADSATFDASGANSSATLTIDNISFYARNDAHTLTLTGGNMGQNTLSANFGDYSTYSSTLTKSGTGVWVLKGSNTYTGATSVNAGILVFAKKAAKGAGTVTGSNGASIGLGVGTTSDYYTSSDIDSLFSNSLSGFTLNTGAGVAVDTTAGDFTYTTSQSNNRALAKLGANKLILTGNNTFAANTIIYEGTLQIGDGTSGSIASGTVSVSALGILALNQANGASFGGAIVNQGTVKMISPNQNTLAGVISGTGGFSQEGSGTTTLSGVNTYTGVTSVTGGELKVNGSLATASSVFISSGATLAGSGTVGGIVTGTDANINGSGLRLGATTLYGNSALSGTNNASSVTVASGTTSVTGKVIATGNFSVSGGAAVKNTNSITAAMVNISSGATLTNKGTVIGDVNVTGSLNGAGTVQGSLTIKDTGELSTGNSPGVTTVTGVLKVENGAKISLQIDGMSGAGIAGGYDQIDVTSTGGVTLETGSILMLTLNTVLGSNTSITLINNESASGIIGRFSEVVIGGSTYDLSASNFFTDNGQQYALSYTATSGLDGIGNDLTLMAVPEPSTWAMIVGGVGVLIGIQRMRRQTGIKEH